MLHRSREWSKPFAQAEVPHPSALKLDGSPWHNDSETVVQNCSRNPLGRPNRSWPVVELVSGSRKRKLENGGQRLARQNLEFGPETLKIRRWRPDGCGLTRRNVGGSPAPGNHTAETALAGWGARIRTWEWRNQNPQKSIDIYSISSAMLHLCRIKRERLSLQKDRPPYLLRRFSSCCS